MGRLFCCLYTVLNIPHGAMNSVRNRVVLRLYRLLSAMNHMAAWGNRLISVVGTYHILRLELLHIVRLTASGIFPTQWAGG